MFYDDYSENQVSAQIVMVFASIAPVLSIMSIQREQRHAAGRALHMSASVEHFGQMTHPHIDMKLLPLLLLYV